MTLKTRNRYTLTFSTFFLFVSALVSIYFLYKVKAVASGQIQLNYGISLENPKLFERHYISIIVSSLFMALYIPTVSFYIYARFEKTPSSEVAYLMLFLLGCLIFFLPTISEWAAAMGFESVGKYMIFGLVGGNFLFELLFNIILSPIIVRLIRIGSHRERV